MKIRKFNESEEINISNERIDDIIKELNTFKGDLKEKSSKIISYIKEFENYKSLSKTKNDQIDDSVIYLQSISKNISNFIDDTDTIIDNLNSYKDSGRSTVYTKSELKKDF
jgi:molecular chaperone GrpE (heat shock protein)